MKVNQFKFLKLMANIFNSSKFILWNKGSSHLFKRNPRETKQHIFLKDIDEVNSTSVKGLGVFI